MFDRNYYCLCEDNCKFPTMTKEQILSAITQAVESGKIQDVDTGFVSKVKTVNGSTLKFFVGSQSEYESLAKEDKENLFAIITNDTTKEAIYAELEALRTDLSALEENLPNISVEHAAEADLAKQAEHSLESSHAATADSATTAETASKAYTATAAYKATIADTATNAEHATTADSAATATNATTADNLKNLYMHTVQYTATLFSPVLNADVGTLLVNFNFANARSTAYSAGGLSELIYAVGKHYYDALWRKSGDIFERVFCIETLESEGMDLVLKLYTETYPEGQEFIVEMGALEIASNVEKISLY